MSVSNATMGRLGNSIFIYLASSIFAIVYNLKRDNDINNEYNFYKHSNFEFSKRSNCKIIVNDNDFINWKNNFLYKNKLNIIKKDINYNFIGYFQHDDILKKFKSQLIEYIKNNPEHLLKTSDNINFKAIEILKMDKPFNQYKIVLHLRLEDFINYDLVMNPIFLTKILDNYKNEKICIVINKIKNKLEAKYVNFFQRKYDIVIESNDVITDYHIMKNSKILICSFSTLSWIASFFSETIETVYFPDYKQQRLHETFKKPIENTILYQCERCNKYELNNILNS
jgi:hypothetical protein